MLSPDENTSKGQNTKDPPTQHTIHKTSKHLLRVNDPRQSKAAVAVRDTVLVVYGRV